MTATNWINHIENIGATCELKDLQDAICACPESLYDSPLYIFVCSILMGRALTEDVTQIDLTKAPYEGAGALDLLNPKFDLPSERISTATALEVSTMRILLKKQMEKKNMTAKNWINYLENIGACTGPLKDLQEAICACPKSLYDSPLYIFVCGTLMGRALAEDTTQIDLTKAPYEGAGALGLLNPKLDLPSKEVSSSYGS